MRSGYVVAAVSTVVAALALTVDVSAQDQRTSRSVQIERREQPTSGYYRRARPQVRGYVERRGGYSYSPVDVINTYGDSRSKYGSTNVYRDPSLDRQTNFGPFDHGFFFDSGIAPRGGNSPYPN